MLKGETERWSILITVFLINVINVAAICGMIVMTSHLRHLHVSEFLDQQKVSIARSDGQALVHLAGIATEYTNAMEYELQSKSMRLEASARKNYEHRRRLFERAPARDWEKIARVGARKIQKAWNKSLVCMVEQSWWEEPGFVFSSKDPDQQHPLYPFQRVVFKDGKNTGVMVLAAPFYHTNYYRGEEARALFWRLKAKGHVIIGLMSYQDFPDPIVNPYEDRHVMLQDKAVFQAMDAWFYCSRQPDQILPSGVPRLFLSESDFTNPMWGDPERDVGGGSLRPDMTIQKEYDVVFSNQGGEWNDFCRNWTLAKASVKRLITELNLKVLVFGRNLTTAADNDLQEYITGGHLSAAPQGLDWPKFLKTMQMGKALFVPNVHDASPRVVTEALCLDIPIVMNYHIVGGWKYINEYTGEFFTDSRDVVDAFTRLRDPTRAAKLRPRAWFMETWGYQWSSYLLQAFLEEVVGKDRLATLARNMEYFDAETEAFYKSEKRRGEIFQY